MHRKLWHTRRIWMHIMAWETWKPCRWFCSGIAVAPVMGLTPSRWWIDDLHKSASYYDQSLRNEMFCRKCLKLLPCFEKSIRNVQKVFTIPGKWSIYRGKCRSRNFCSGQHNITIKQIRVFVGLILQPEMDPPKIVPDPAINIERDESSQSHHTVSTTLLPSGINVFSA